MFCARDVPVRATISSSTHFLVCAILLRLSTSSPEQSVVRSQCSSRFRDYETHRESEEESRFRKTKLPICRGPKSEEES